MSIRKITFPDHTAADFDPDQVFEADNELKYIWNGYGWELVDGGIDAYDDQWIKDDQDRQDEEIEEIKDALKPQCYSKTLTVVESTGNYPTLPSDTDEIGINTSAHPNSPRLIIAEAPADLDGANGLFKQGEYTFGDAIIELSNPAAYRDGWYGFHYDVLEGTMPAVGDVTELSYNECPELGNLTDYVRKDEFTQDQNRQDKETKDRDAFLEVEVIALAAKFKEDQDRQDDEFAKGQAAQDDAFAKGQAVQDKALQEEKDARAERDLQHDAQIETIEYKLDALLGLQFRGIYRFGIDVDCEQQLLECYAAAAGDITAQQQCNKDHVACEQGKVQRGEFEALDPDGQFDKLLAIVVHLTDLSGIETEWGNVLNKDDYLEIDHQIGGTADKTNYGLYRIKAEPEVSQNALNENVYSFELEFLQGDGEMLEGEIYEIRGINKDEGVNPEELGDFLTKDDAMDTYLPLIGGTLKGTLNMSDNNVINTRHLDSGNNSNLEIKRNGERRILVGSNEVVFDKAPEFGGPINTDNQLVNKKYVDNNKPADGQKGAKGARGYTGGSGSKGNRGSSGSTGATGSVKMKTGTSTSPTLSRGEMYWNYNNFVIYVGK